MHTHLSILSRGPAASDVAASLADERNKGVLLKVTHHSLTA